LILESKSTLFICPVLRECLTSLAAEQETANSAGLRLDAKSPIFETDLDEAKKNPTSKQRGYGADHG
jgi:hypothetical protein